jgi:hypothetical protein
VRIPVVGLGDRGWLRRSAWHDAVVPDPVELERLVEQGAYGEVLAAVSLAEIAEAWIAYHRAEHVKLDEGDPFWWAVDFWLSGSGVWADEDLARLGLLALIEAAPDDLLGHVGAGPLETFVSDDESRVRWIEDQAAQSDRFRRALANVWTWGTEPNAIASRLERAAGVRLPRPKGWTGP